MRLDDYAAKITDFVASGSFASLRENVHYYKEENYAILVRTADFGSNFQKDLVYLDKQGYDFLSNSNLVGGELILPNIGASIGKVFIVPQLHKPMTLGPNSILIRTYIEEMTKYLYFVFSSSWGFDLLHDISSATAQGKFNKTDLKNIFLPIPPIEEQRRIIQSINLWLAQIDNIDANKADLLYAIQQTRYKVLDLALHGQLVSQDPNDEPAIELLKRVNPNAPICDTLHYGNLPKGWAVCRLEDIVKYEQPSQFIVESTDYSDEYKTPVLTPGKSFILGYTNETKGIYTNIPTIIFDDFTTDSRFVDFPFKVKSSAMKILQVKKEINIKYVAYFMSVTRLVGDTHKRYWISEYSKIPIQIPPRKEQDRIVQKIQEIENIIQEISAEL